MAATRDRIEHLVVRIQSDFFDNPTLALTLPAAEKRFGIDEVVCAGVLDALVDAWVLTERSGAYRRYFPPQAARRIAESSEGRRGHPGGRPMQEALMIEFRRILCPVDFSDYSRSALDHANLPGSYAPRKVTR